MKLPSQWFKNITSLCKPRKLSANSPPPLIWRWGFKRKFTKKNKIIKYSLQFFLSTQTKSAAYCRNIMKSRECPEQLQVAQSASGYSSSRSSSRNAGRSETPVLRSGQGENFFFCLFFNFSFSFSRSFDDQKEPCRPLLRFGGWTLGGDTSSWSAGAAGAAALLRLWCWNRKNKDIQKWNSVSRYNLKAFAVEINCALSGVRLYLWGLWSVSWPRLAPQSRNTKLWWRTWNTNGKNSVFSGCHCCL